MSVLTTTSRWFRRSLAATAIAAAGVMAIGAATTPAKAQAYPYYPYYGYSPYYSYYSPYYYPYYGYRAPVAVNVGWGWGWYGGRWGWGWHGGHHWHRR